MSYSYREIYNGEVVYYIASRKITGFEGFAVSKLECGWWTHLYTFETEEEARKWVDAVINYRLEQGV